MIRKIKTQEEIDAKKKKNKTILAVFIIGIMAFSTLGYAFVGNGDGAQQKKKYNGFTFVENNGYWTTNAQNQIFYFKYLPQEIENVSVKGIYNLQTYSAKPLYFVNNNMASNQILNNIGNLVSRYQEACLEGMNCTSNLPIKTCDDNVIIFENFNENSSSETKVYQNKNCVYILGDFTKGVDALSYKLAKIR
ncbi:MAG: hypothetical protein Q7S33_00065 [Nanoarchaeota archaeon]|nr:hypothetical protein [Nanoarchaeota archaeon]